MVACVSVCAVVFCARVCILPAHARFLVCAFVPFLLLSSPHGQQLRARSLHHRRGDRGPRARPHPRARGHLGPVLVCDAEVRYVAVLVVGLAQTFSVADDDAELHDAGDRERRDCVAAREEPALAHRARGARASYSAASAQAPLQPKCVWVAQRMSAMVVSSTASRRRSRRVASRSTRPIRRPCGPIPLPRARAWSARQSHLRAFRAGAAPPPPCVANPRQLSLPIIVFPFF